MEYHEYLKTEHWQEVKELKLQSVNYKCQVCNSGEELNVHHRSYTNLYNEQNYLEDLTVICKECHELYHERLKKIPIRYSIEKLNELLEKFEKPTPGGSLRIPQEFMDLDQEDRDWIVENWEDIRESKKRMTLREGRITLMEELSKQTDEEANLLKDKTIEEINEEIKKNNGEQK